MKAFFSRKHDSQTGQSKSASKDPFKLWINHSDKKNATKPVQADATRPQATSNRAPKPTSSFDKPVPAPPTGAPTETTIYQTTRTNTVPQPTYPHPSSSQLPPKATTRPQDYDDVRYHPPPRAATSAGFFTTTSQTREERTKSSRGYLRNEAATITRREVWAPATTQATSKPAGNTEEKYHEKIFTEELENYRGQTEKELKQAKREDRQKFKSTRDREDRGFISEREVDRDHRYRNREKERKESEAERMKELEGEKERIKAREKEREREIEREKARERERRLKAERERQKEIEREKEQREQERQKEIERERERERQEMEREKERQRERERLRQENERERERERQEMEREKERQRERERLRQEIEKERERERQEMEREKERQRERERLRQEIEKERERVRQEMEREKERQRERERLRQEIEKERERVRQEMEREKERQRERERLRQEIENEKERERERQKEVEREKERQRERARLEIERERERQRELEREKERERERQKEIEREKERQRERERERARQEIEREKERQRGRELEREREQERENERERERQARERREYRDKTRAERRDQVEDYDRLHREHDSQRDKEQERELKDNAKEGPARVRVVNDVDYRRDRTVRDRYQTREQYPEHRNRGEATDSEQETFRHRTSDQRRSGRTSDNYGTHERRSSRPLRQEPTPPMGDEDTSSSDDFVILDPPPRQDQLADANLATHPKPSQTRQHHPSGGVNPMTGNSIQIQPNPIMSATLPPYTTPRMATVQLPSNERAVEHPPPLISNTISTGAAQDARRGISRTKLDNREDLDSAQPSSEPSKSLEPPRRPPSRASVIAPQVQRAIYASVPQSQALHKQSNSQSMLPSGTVDGNKETLHTRARSEDLKAPVAPSVHVFNAHSNSNHESGPLRVEGKEFTSSTDNPVGSSKEPQIFNGRHSRMSSDGQKETRAIPERHIESLGDIRDFQSRETRHSRLPSEEKENPSSSYPMRSAHLQNHAVSNANGDIENHPDKEIGSAVRPMTALDSTGRPWVAIPGIPQPAVQVPASQTASLSSLERSNPDDNPSSSVQNAIPSRSQTPAGNFAVLPSALSREDSNIVAIPSSSRQVVSLAVQTQQPNTSFAIAAPGERSNATAPPVPLHTVPPPSNYLLSSASAETPTASTHLPPLRSFAPPVRPHPPNGNYATPNSAASAERSAAAAAAAAAAQSILSPGSLYPTNENVGNLNAFSFERTTAIISSVPTPPQMRFQPSNGSSATPFQTPPEVLVSIPEVGDQFSQPQDTRQAAMVREKVDHRDFLSLSKTGKEETMTKTNESPSSSKRPSPRTPGLNIEENVAIAQHSTTGNYVSRPRASGLLSPESLGIRAEHGVGNSEAYGRHLTPRTQYEEVESTKAIHAAGVRHDASSATVGIPSLFQEMPNRNPIPEQIVVPSIKRSPTTAMKESSADVRSPPIPSSFDNIGDSIHREPVQHRAKLLSYQQTSDSSTPSREPTNQEQMVSSSYKLPTSAGAKRDSAHVYELPQVSHPVTHRPPIDPPPGPRKLVGSDETTYATAQEHIGLSISRPPTRSDIKKDITSNLLMSPRNLLESQYTWSQDPTVQGPAGMSILQPVSRRDFSLSSQFPQTQEVPSEKHAPAQGQTGYLAQPPGGSVVRKDTFNNVPLSHVATDNCTPLHSRQGRGAEFFQATPAVIQRSLQSDESPKPSSHNGVKAQAIAKDKFLSVNASKSSMEHSNAAQSMPQNNDVDGTITFLSTTSRNATLSSHITLGSKQNAPLSNPVVANTPLVAHVTLPNTANDSRPNAKHDTSTFQVQSTMHVPAVTSAGTRLLPDAQGTESGDVNRGNPYLRLPIHEPQAVARTHVVESVPQIKIRHLVTATENKQELEQTNGANLPSYRPQERSSVPIMPAFVQQNISSTVGENKGVKGTATSVNITDKDGLQNRHKAKDALDAKLHTAENVHSVPSAPLIKVPPSDNDKYNPKKYQSKKESPSPRRLTVHLTDDDDDHGVSRSGVPRIPPQKKGDTETLRQAKPPVQQPTSVVDKVESQKNILPSAQPGIQHPVLAELLSSPLKKSSPDMNQTPTTQGDSGSTRRLTYADSQPRLRDTFLERPKHEVDQKRQHLPKEGTPPLGVHEYHAVLSPQYGKNMNTGLQSKDRSASNQADTPLPRTTDATVQSDEQILHRRNLGSSVPPQSVQGSRTATHEAFISAKAFQGSDLQTTGATTSREARPHQSAPLNRHHYASSIHVPSTPFPNAQDLPRSATPAVRQGQQAQSHVKQKAGYAAEKPLASLPRATASEETILMTPASLAPSLTLKPTSSRQSNAESVNSQKSKRSGLLSRFRRTTQAQPAQKHEVLQPQPSSKTPDSSPEHPTPLEVKAATQNAKTLNAVQRVPLSNGNHRNPDSRVFTPFKHLTSRKKKRSLSSASMEARDGETSTVIGSPTASMHSTTPLPLPPIRDPWQATHEWLIREEDNAQARPKGRRHRPGVVIEAGDDAPEDRERRLKRNVTKYRSSARRQEPQNS